MKRIATLVLFTIVALVTAGGARAQAHSVRARVPFAFTAGNDPLPPGNYEITTSSSGVIEIRNRDNSVAVLTTTTYNSKELRNGAKLVFSRYGSQFFLSEILCAYAPLNVSLPSSNQEKRARQQKATITTPNAVFIAAK